LSDCGSRYSKTRRPRRKYEAKVSWVSNRRHTTPSVPAVRTCLVASSHSPDRESQVRIASPLDGEGVALSVPLEEEAVFGETWKCRRG
jgi:hypothetical protein